jgi:hypothetical protein
MYSIDLFAAEATIAAHTTTVQQSAQHRRLLRHTREQRSGWVSQVKGRWVHYLGQRLVTLGKWLEAFGHPRPSF